MASSALGRNTSWKDRLTRKFIGDRDKDREKTPPIDAKEEEWCFIDVNNSEMEVNSVDGPKRKTSKGHLASPVVGIGARSSSVGSRVSRSETKLQRPVSPHESPQGSPQSKMKRTPSGRAKKLEVHMVHAQHNGRASPNLRSASPTRSSVRKKGGIMVPPRTSSPSEPPKDHLKETPKVNPKDPSAKGPEFSFAKVRDTLRIHRPKKRKGIKNVPYSSQYSAPEINLSPPSKYQDPFEAQATFMDSTEVPKLGQGHDFKPASIPHNKPEYCDHCGDTAWGLYRQVLKCSKCDFIVHRKCEQKVVIDCSARLEQAVLQHDKQVEECAVPEDEPSKEKEEPELVIKTNSSTATTDHTDTAVSTSSSSSSSTSSTTTSVPHHLSSQLISEKAKLSRKIREYNRKTTPVNHIHMKSASNTRADGVIEYQGFVRVHMCVQRPIHVSTAITRTSWYRLMRPVKERGNDMHDGFETAFYLPTDTNRLVHISNATTTKELVQILLRKFCVTDNPKKFSLYEEYGGDCRRLFEEDYPLQIVLEGSCAHRNSKLVLRDNTYSTIQWDAFTQPELQNFIQILQREEEIYADKLKERFKIWRGCMSQVLKEKCMDSVSKQTRLNISSQLPKSDRKLESVV